MRHSISLVFASVLLFGMITGCPGTGGQNQTPDPGTPQSANAKLVLPSGVGGDLTTLNVSTALGSASPDANGNVSLTVFSDGSQLATVTDASNHVLAFAWLNKGSNEISAHTTAQVLLALRLGVFDETPAVSTGVIAQLATAPQVDALTSAIAAALSADPGALTDPNASWLPLFQQTAGALLSAPPTASTNQSNKRINAHRAAIDPSTELSGLSVVEDALNDIQVQDSTNRRVLIIAERVSYKDAQGNSVPSPNLETEFELPGAKPVAGQAFLSSLSGIRAPTMNSVKVPVIPSDAQSTEYRVRALGPGGDPGVEASLSDAEKMQLTNQEQRFFVLDLLCPPLMYLLTGAGSQDLSDLLQLANNQTLVTSVRSAMQSSHSAGVDKLAAHDYAGAYQAVIDEMVNNDTEFNAMLNALLAGLPSIYQNSVDHDSAARSLQGLIKSSQQWITSEATDRLQRRRIEAAARAQDFKVVEDKGNVKLDPGNAVVTVRNPNVDLNATVQFAPGAANPTFVYDWNTTSSLITLSYSANGQGGSGTTLSMISSATVTCMRTSGEGTATVFVTAYDASTTPPTKIGDAHAMIKSQNNDVDLEPQNPSISANYTIEFAVILPPDLQTLVAGETLHYTWTAVGGHGFFEGGSATTDTTDPHATYMAQTDGVDTVRVTVSHVVQGETLPIGEPNTQVTIDDNHQEFVQGGGWGFEQSYSYDPVSNFNNSSYGIFFKFTPIPGAKSYAIDFTNFHDYGGGSGGTGYRWSPQYDKNGKPTNLPDGWSFDQKDDANGYPLPGDPQLTGEIRIGYAGGAGFGPGPGNGGMGTPDVNYNGRIAGAVAHVRVTF